MSCLSEEATRILSDNGKHDLCEKLEEFAAVRDADTAPLNTAMIAFSPCSAFPRSAMWPDRGGYC
jgi:hypothetical protein